MVSFNLNTHTHIVNSDQKSTQRVQKKKYPYIKHSYNNNNNNNNSLLVKTAKLRNYIFLDGWVGGKRWWRRVDGVDYLNNGSKNTGHLVFSYDNKYKHIEKKVFIKKHGSWKT
jgi:hypothetical protein